MENLRKKLDDFAKKSKEDNTPLWEQIDEIYGNPLIRAYFYGYEGGLFRHAKTIYNVPYKEQYQDFYDMGYGDGVSYRLMGEGFDEF